MDLLTISLIVVGCVIAFVAIILIIGRISTSNKKLSNFKKKINTIKTESAQTETTDAPKPAAQIDFGRPEKQKGAIVTDYTEFDEDDKKALAEQEVPQETEHQTKRKSFEEIMRNREQMRAAAVQSDEEEFFDDDFDDFRDQHSSYITYQKDDELISQIKGLSPQAKKILFSSLFQRIDHD